MGKNTIYKILLGGMLLTGVSTVGHIYYKDVIKKNYNKTDVVIDIAGITFAAGCAACYGGSKVINMVAKKKQNKLEANLTD